MGVDAGARGIGTEQATASAEAVAKLVKSKHPLSVAVSYAAK